MSEHYFPCGHKIVLGHTCPVCVNTALLAVLKAVEWAPPHLTDGLHDICPSCGHFKNQGHAPDCQLDKALRAADPD